MDLHIPPNGGGGEGGGETGCFGGDPEADCTWCEIVAGAISIIICALTIWWVPGAATFCIELLEIYHITGSTHITCQIVGCC